MSESATITPGPTAIDTIERAIVLANDAHRISGALTAVRRSLADAATIAMLHRFEILCLDLYRGIENAYDGLPKAYRNALISTPRNAPKSAWPRTGVKMRGKIRPGVGELFLVNLSNWNFETSGAYYDRRPV
jgi:hypothetical protein